MSAPEAARDGAALVEKVDELTEGVMAALDIATFVANALEGNKDDDAQAARRVFRILEEHLVKQQDLAFDVGEIAREMHEKAKPESQKAVRQ